MGYTHYYRIKTDSPEWKAIWPQLLKDANKIISRCGIPVTNPNADYAGYYDEEFPPPIVDIHEGIYVNGVGSGAHEPLVIGDKDYKSGEFAFTKTVRKPYDDVVTCILLRAYMLAPSACRVSSDGYWDEWEAARSVYKSLFGEEPKCPWGEGDDVGEDEE